MYSVVRLVRGCFSVPDAKEMKNQTTEYSEEEEQEEQEENLKHEMLASIGRVR